MLIILIHKDLNIFKCKVERKTKDNVKFEGIKHLYNFYTLSVNHCQPFHASLGEITSYI